MARSTLAAVTVAMADAMDNGIFLASMYAELMIGIKNACPEGLDVHRITDSKSLYSKSLYEAIKSNKSVFEKRLRTEISAINYIYKYLIDT